jgi:16S rRNA (guanine527-N7)-methyltransferase
LEKQGPEFSKHWKNKAMTSLPPKYFLEGLAELDLRLEEDVILRLGQYVDLLLAANQQINLTAVREPDAAWVRHILDSLTIARSPDRDQHVIDVGSGGGLPGIPLAIVRPDLHVALLEATGKKAAFLETTAQTLGLAQVRVISDRAETAGHDATQRAHYDLAVGRAVSALPVFLELTAPLIQIGGRILAMKGKRVGEELASAHHALGALGLEVIQTHTFFAGQEHESHVVELIKQETTHEKYPRRPGMPAKRPL